MKRMFAALALAASVAAAVVAAPTFVQNYSISGTSPDAGNSGAQGVVVPGLNEYSTCTVYAVLAGGTGGTLDVVLQSSVNAGAAGSWYELAHFPQIAADAGTSSYVAVLTRGASSPAAPVAINAVDIPDAGPVLAANTILPSALGDTLRSVYYAGSGTDAGVAQTINMLCSTR